MRENYAAWEIPRYTAVEFKKLNKIEQLIYLCQLGHLAPSTHNTQPWRFFIDGAGESIEVYLDSNFILPASDVVGRQAVISIGCAIENIIIGAEHFGLDCLVTYNSKNLGEKRWIKMASLNFNSGSRRAKNNLFTAIFTRKVTRAEYDPTKAITAPIIKELENITDGRATKLHIVSDMARRLSIAEFQAQADSFVINSPKFSRELGKWLLPNDTNSFLGMPGAGFGLNDDESVRLHRGLSGNGHIQPEDGLRLALGGKIGIEKSPLIGIITVAKDNIEHWLAAGRAFERMFLTLESHGAAVAVHAGIAEVALVNKIFAATLGTLRKIVVLFRAGFVKRPADENRPHSPRLPIKAVILKKKPQE